MPRGGGGARVIEAPFRGDQAVAGRLAALVERVGPAIVADLTGGTQRHTPDMLAGSTLSHQSASELVERHGLASTIELALLALPVAEGMARAAISGYRVPAIGIEAQTGDLLFGANLEFPGADLTATVHAEGFVALRARRRGHALATLVVRRARPCAFCRQTLVESAGAQDMRLVDLEGHDVSLPDIYPWAFRPGALGVEPDESALAWPNLDLPSDTPAEVASALVEAGARAHAPYSKAPSAVALRLRDGRVMSAACVESVAFNPTITALQAALVEVVAARYELEDVAEGWLARTWPAPVDPEPAFRALLAAVAPTARADVVDWRAAS